MSYSLVLWRHLLSWSFLLLAISSFGQVDPKPVSTACKTTHLSSVSRTHVKTEQPWGFVIPALGSQWQADPSSLVSQLGTLIKSWGSESSVSGKHIQVLSSYGWWHLRLFTCMCSHLYVYPHTHEHAYTYLYIHTQASMHTKKLKNWD